MRVCLIVPQCLSPKQTYREYPLGVGLIATALRRGGHEVAIYDQAAEGGDDDALLARLGQFAPDVAGFSLVTPSYPVARRQIARLKAQWPDLPVLAGGIHANLFPEDLLADGADAVVLGQGQAVMPRLLERLDRRESWGELPGLVFRDRRGDCVRTAPRAVAAAGQDGPGPAGDAGAEDPDVIDRSVYNLPLYTHHSMLASLGCPFACAFCCNFSGTVLHSGVSVRPAGRVLDEMEYLVNRYQAEKIFFVDDVFLLTRANILAFCRQLRQRKLSVQWIAQMRVDTLDAEVAAAMAEAGCKRVYFGVESGSDAILRRVRKALTCEAIRQGVRHAKAAGMRVKTGWIFGLPGTLAEQYETLPFLRELRPHEVSIHQLIPFPGTDYYARPAEHGIRIRDPKDFESFCYGGLGDNVSFDYLPRGQLLELLERAAAMLESEGYVASDRSTGADEYVYSTPLSAVSMTVFRPGR
jgi:radical SAM superfamily enzyme YgiQ (UPF0313 family)